MTDKKTVLAAGLSVLAHRPVLPEGDATTPELKVDQLLSVPMGTGPLRIPSDFLSPEWDRDYRHPSKYVHGLELSRGGLSYVRPFGWLRVALSVKGRYGGSDEWLGTSGSSPTLRETRISSDEGEWAVSFVGVGATPDPSVDENPAAKGLVVSSPFPKLAKSQAKEFNCDGRAYKMLLQLRVDPVRTERIQDGDYYVTKELSAVRPYGVLVLDLGPAEERSRRRGGKVSMAVMLQNILDKMREEAS